MFPDPYNGGYHGVPTGPPVPGHGPHGPHGAPAYHGAHGHPDVHKGHGVVSVNRQRWDGSFIAVAVALAILGIANVGMNIGQLVQLGELRGTEDQILVQMDGHLPHAVVSMDAGSITSWQTDTPRTCTVTAKRGEAGLVQFDMATARSQTRTKNTDGTIEKWAGTRTANQLAQDYTYISSTTQDINQETSSILAALHTTSKTATGNDKVVLLMRHGTTKGTPVTIQSVTSSGSGSETMLKVTYTVNSGTCYLSEQTSPHTSAAPVYFVGLS